MIRDCTSMQRRGVRAVMGSCLAVGSAPTQPLAEHAIRDITCKKTSQAVCHAQVLLYIVKNALQLHTVIIVKGGSVLLIAKHALPAQVLSISVHFV